MMEQVDLDKQSQWEAGPGEDIKIPERYIRQLKYEIVVLDQKKEFVFRCSRYMRRIMGAGGWQFDNVIIDTSKLNAKGEVELKRVSYHPEIVLVNVSFMVLPAPEELIPEEAA